MAAHRLVHGELTDFLTGAVLPDTDDERLRQAIARRLVESGGYARGEIRPRVPLGVRAGEKRARLTLDFVVELPPRPAMLIRFGPGSLVTRHRPGLAAARLLGPTVVPVVVVTNGRDADVLDAVGGDLLGTGLEAIPTRADLARRLTGTEPVPVAPRQAEMAARILYAFEVDGACACDDEVCRLADGGDAPGGDGFEGPGPG